MRFIKSSALVLGLAGFIAASAPSEARISFNGKVSNRVELSSGVHDSSVPNGKAAHAVKGDGAFARLDSITLANGVSARR
jgi:hypothetical protein